MSFPALRRQTGRTPLIVVYVELRGQAKAPAMYGRSSAKVFRVQLQAPVARVWTTNGWSANTKVEDVAAFRTYRDQAYPQRHFPAGTRLCAEGFRGGSSVGLPCVTLTG
ncbi:hypothetical protein [Streptomyces sp. ISL-44]|uniref:hypothetical protein n=1 Tax=Streptomyces sp. ISL-44 TaxID=2819184 RepID=UPI0027E30D8D|nr:hypothetical protein [Streptomyces sp. ISL-44]